MTEMEIRDAPSTAEAPEADRPANPPLIVFGADDDLVCVDDTCLPPGTSG
jgi:hypothetical protein